MVIDGETGIPFPMGDVDALAAAMQRLIDDPELRERMGQAGQERIKRFGPDFIVPRFEKLFHQLMTGEIHTDQSVSGRA